MVDRLAVDGEAAGGVRHQAKVEAGANVVVFGLGGIGLNVIQAAKMVGADKIIGVDINPKRQEMARKFGMTHFINPKETANVVDTIVQLTDGGADYSFECVGNTQLMREALECTHKGWGQSFIIGVAAAGQEISTRPFQLVTGREWKGSAFGGARGRTDVPKIVDWYMEGKLNIDDLITHRLPHELMRRRASVKYHGADRFARLHQVETFVDAFERQPVRDQVVISRTHRPCNSGARR